MRARPFDPRRRGLRGTRAAVASVLAVTLPAVAWGLLTRSAWVAAATLALCALPPAWLRAGRPPALAWLGYGFLAGGTVAAAALLTGHARAP